MESPQNEQIHSVLREAHLRDYWKVVWQGRWTILAVFFVIVGVTAVWSFLQTPIYRATATIEVQPQARRVAAGQDVSGIGAGSYGWFAEEKYHNTQVEIIKSRDVARRVVQKLDLTSDPYFAESTDVIESFRGLVEAIPRRETGLIEVSISGPDKEQITHWVNEVAREYVERNFEKARANAEKAIRTIEDQMSAFEQQYADAENKRFQALQDVSIYDPETQEELVSDKLKTYYAERTKAQLERVALEGKLGQIRELQVQGADLMSMPELADDVTLRDLYNNKVSLERELESNKVEFKPGHPQYTKTASELAKVEERIRQRMSSIQGTLTNKYKFVREREQDLEEKIRAAENDSMRVHQAISNTELVQTKAETKKHLFDIIDNTMNEVRLGAQMLDNNVSVLDEAPVPRYPIKPRKKVNLAIGSLMGLFLGLAAAFFLDYLDNTFRTPEDIEKYLKLSVLGVIPKLEKERAPGAAVKEAYQSLRTSIIFSSKNRTRKIVLVTSTGPQEGKSSTVGHLARTLATAGDEVLVLDCDLRRPTQHLIHQLERTDGMTNYLSAPVDQTDWSGYPKSVKPANLHVMTCGPIPPSPPELLGSDRFAALLKSARERYDWVLIDSPPAATLADSTLLAALSDMIVLVVKYNHTDRDLVAKTVQRLRTVNPIVAGAVLNNVDLSRAYNKDYYYAGYYYSGASEDAASDAESPELKSNVG